MNTQKNEAERDKLRMLITRITKRAPRADASLEHLRKRLAMLQSTEMPTHDAEERARPQSFSLTESQAEALSKLCDKTKKNGSQCVRAALAFYAKHLGHISIARTFDADITNSKES